MVDIVITAANVLAGTAAATAEGTALVAITAGQVVAIDTATGKIALADSNSATAGIRSPVGIALHGAAAGQPIEYAKSGLVTVGGTLVAGTAYYLSDTPGGIAPVADVGTGEYPTILGIATSTTVLKLKIQESGVALP